MKFKPLSESDKALIASRQAAKVAEIKSAAPAPFIDPKISISQTNIQPTIVESPTPIACVNSEPSPVEATNNDKRINKEDFATANIKSDIENSSSPANVNTVKNYPADTVDNSAPLKDNKYQVLNFESPFDVVSLYDSSVRQGTTTLHPWQLDVNDTLGREKPTSLLPYKFALCACNGSGKDAYVIAPFAIWFAITKIKSRVIITSSSGVQLTSQTEHYIKSLAQAINEFHGENIFKINQRYIKCLLSGSEIRLFATDEEGKAEGYHPITPLSEMAIIINEAKSVDAAIFRALRRCTGYNYWIEVSTPGPPHGDFYTHFTKWMKWGRARHIDTFQCPHLSPQEREEDKVELGEHSALYRSKHLALFTSEEGQCIIPVEVIDKNKNSSRDGFTKWLGREWPLRIGIDLAAGGDENSIYCCKGNKITNRNNFREKDTTITAKRIDTYLLSLDVPKLHDFIFADDGGIGRGVIDQLINNYGWAIKRILNQSASSDKKLYLNRGAENWYRTKRIFDENLWYFDPSDDDLKLFTQLSSRYYKQQGTMGRIALESKQDAKALGRPSPDRADAFILTFTGLTVDDFLSMDYPKEDSTKPNSIPPLHTRKGFKTIEEIQAWQEEQAYAAFGGSNVPLNGEREYTSNSARGNAYNILSNLNRKTIPNRRLQKLR